MFATPEIASNIPLVTVHVAVYCRDTAHFHTWNRQSAHIRNSQARHPSSDELSIVHRHRVDDWPVWLIIVGGSLGSRGKRWGSTWLLRATWFVACLTEWNQRSAAIFIDINDDACFHVIEWMLVFHAFSALNVSLLPCSLYPGNSRR